MKTATCVLSAVIVSVLSAYSANAQTMSLTNDTVYDYEAYIGTPEVVWGFHFKVYKSSGTPEWYGPFTSQNLMVNWAMNMVDQGRADDWVATEWYEGPRTMVLDWMLEGTYDTSQEATDAMAAYRPYGRMWRTKIERISEMSFRRRR